jgi:hypothetical protein
LGYRYEKNPIVPSDIIGAGSKGWSSHIEIPALQPQRKLSPQSVFFIGAFDSCDVVVTAKIFADTLPEPVTQVLNLKITVDKIDAEALGALREILIAENKSDEVLLLDNLTSYENPA